jgi:2-(1,2-epoxy-1,2-dihydrophenyl)acetyl-CoA isomerase
MVLLEVDGPVAGITLNRPETLNALNRPARSALARVLEDVRGREAVRAVVLTGAGRAFSVGQDVQELQADYRTQGPELARLIHEEWGPLVTGLRTLPKPIIAAVNGAAAGGGLSLALACDIRLAEPRTNFIAAFVNVGLVPDSGAAHMMVRSLGLSRAMHLALTGERLGAEEALRVGLVAQMADSPEGLRDAAVTLAGRLAAMAPQATAGVKDVMNQAADLAFQAVVDLEAVRQDALGRTHDHQEALQAFLEKRPPRFEGR